MAVTLANGIMKLTASNDTYSGNIIPKSVRVVGMTTAGHKAELSDSASSVIARFSAMGNGYAETVYLDGVRASGLLVTDLDSGELFVNL